MAHSIRKNVIFLPAAEWDRFVAAMNELKASGVYDEMTRRHVRAMMKSSPWYRGETGTLRNAAHRGPVFGPWHRQALRELELALQAVDPVVPGIPYWSWDIIGTRDWRTSAVWSRVGGNGSSANGWRVTTGPFRNWTSVIYNNGTFSTRAGIIRRFAATGYMPGPPSTSIRTWDAAPWNESSPSGSSFRRALEIAHNAVHNNIGGDMLAATSPNDPIFWLHHCNVDRLWAAWQQRQGIDNYQPRGEGPADHNYDDRLLFLNSSQTTMATNGHTLNWQAMDYEYN